MASLTRGALHKILSGSNEANFHPVVLVKNARNIPSNAAGGPARWKIVVTDGQDVATAMLATQLASLAECGELADNCLLQLMDYMTNEVGNTKIIVVLGAQVVGMGDPSMADDVGGGNIPAAPMMQGGNMMQSGPANPYGGGGYQQPQHQQPLPQAGYPRSPPGQQHQAASNPPPQGGAYGPPSGVYGAAATSPYGQAPSGGPPPSMYGVNNPAAAAGGPFNSSSSGGAASGQAYNPYGAQANSRPVVRDADVGNIVPISAINPYSSKWTIKARVTAKSDIRKWSNQKGDGHLFSIDLLDATGGEIRGTFFKEACDKWYGQISEQSVYTFSGGKLKVVTNKQFSNLKNNYELTFDTNSDIRPCADDEGIKSVQYNFVKIADLASIEANQMVDILGVIKDVGETAEIVSQKLGGKVLRKRDLTIYDDSNSEIRLTLWNEKADIVEGERDYQPSFVIVVKAAKVGDYQGRSLSTSNTSTVQTNPQLPEAQAMYHYGQQVISGHGPVLQSMSAGGGGDGRGMDPLESRKTIAAIRDDNLGRGEKPDYLTVKGSITYIKSDSDKLWYTACPTVGCMKKVIESNNEWRCEKCNRTYDNCVRRYILSLTASDHTGQVWLSLFNDQTEKLLGGITADHLHSLKEQGDEGSFSQAFTDALFKTYLMKVRVKEETMQDGEPRVKCTVVEMKDLDYITESEQMYQAICKYVR